MAEARSAIMLYFDTAPAIQILDDASCGQLFKAMLKYAMTGEEPDFKDMLLMAWVFIKPKIDADGERYQATVIKNKYAGYCSGAKRSGDKILTKEEWLRMESERSLTDANGNKQTLTDVDGCEPNPIPIPIPIPNPSIIADKPQHKNTFMPPTVEQVREYCSERHNQVNAERFIDYYESVGWIVGNKKMKDWKATVRNWEKNEKGGAQCGRNKGNRADGNPDAIRNIKPSLDL